MEESGRPSRVAMRRGPPQARLDPVEQPIEVPPEVTGGLARRISKPVRFFDGHALGEPADQHAAAAGAEVDGSVERTGHLATRRCERPRGGRETRDCRPDWSASRHACAATTVCRRQWRRWHSIGARTRFQRSQRDRWSRRRGRSNSCAPRGPAGPLRARARPGGAAARIPSRLQTRPPFEKLCESPQHLARKLPAPPEGRPTRHGVSNGQT